ncbi:MAG TPA: hypothetical protein VFA69_06090 [Candidatus Nitrosotalea sp.]|nr:hypothetical protein [Candidatus Nitrosotalea sp.]
MDEIANTQREYVKARLKAEKTRDPKAVKKIKQAQKLLEKAEDVADETMDPKLKKRSDKLFKKFQLISNKLDVNLAE